jgi:hypothetical protein
LGSRAKSARLDSKNPSAAPTMTSVGVSSPRQARPSRSRQASARDHGLELDGWVSVWCARAASTVCVA